MKIKILSGLFTLGLITAVTYGVNKSIKSNTELSNLALSNVEALADGEIGGREDCQPKKGAECKEFYVTPDHKGYDAILDYEKKPGWI